MILLCHLRAKTPLGTAIEGLIQTYQLWARLRRHCLIDTQPCPWIPDHWLSHLRATMHVHQLQIRYQTWTVPPLRQQDQFLMNDFADQNFPHHQLEKLNACRMYLQVTTLAEITDHTGTTLLQQAFLAPHTTLPQGLTNISSSTLQWPTIAPPSIACRRFWFSTVRTLYTGARTGHRLQQPLGPWLRTYDAHQFWNWQMYDTTHLLFQQSNKKTSVYCVITKVDQ